MARILRPGRDSLTALTRSSICLMVPSRGRVLPVPNRASITMSAEERALSKIEGSPPAATSVQEIPRSILREKFLSFRVWRLTRNR